MFSSFLSSLGTTAGMIAGLAVFLRYDLSGDDLERLGQAFYFGLSTVGLVFLAGWAVARVVGR